MKMFEFRQKTEHITDEEELDVVVEEDSEAGDVCKITDVGYEGGVGHVLRVHHKD